MREEEIYSNAHFEMIMYASEFIVIFWFFFLLLLFQLWFESIFAQEQKFITVNPFCARHLIHVFIFTGRRMSFGRKRMYYGYKWCGCIWQTKTYTRAVDVTVDAWNFITKGSYARSKLLFAKKKSFVLYIVRCSNTKTISHALIKRKHNAISKQRRKHFWKLITNDCTHNTE